MSYYNDMKKMKIELNDLIQNNKGKTIQLNPLTLQYGQRFGFGKRTILNTLKDYKDAGQIILYEDSFEVL